MSSNARRPARFQSLLLVVGISIGIVSLVALSTSHSNSGVVTTLEIHELRMADYVKDRRGLSKPKAEPSVKAGDVKSEESLAKADENRPPLPEPPAADDTASPIVVPHLDCTPFEQPPRTPDSAYAQEMVYWKDIQYDEIHNPFLADRSSTTQYMTFEPDGGGWNNIRMAMETVVALAIATGRTLVLPPEQRMYLLAKNRGKMKTDFGFHDFFTVKDWKHSGVDIITMEEFLERTAMNGQMRYKSNGTIAFPPDNNRTDWNGKDVKVLKTWLREVEQTVHWQPGQCLAVFGKESTDFEGMLNGIISKGEVLKDNYLDSLLPMNAETSLRLRENLAKRSSVCRYNTTLQQAPALHFMCSHKDKVRLLVHFYAFVFFDDWKADLWMKRFVRDHVRYVDEIQCAASRIIRELRKMSPNGIYDALHVRRGDFQYKHTRIEADEILANINATIPVNTTLYIATDERDKNFFKALKENYNVKFMDDFIEALGPDLNHNFYGMIDQLVASRSRTFFGCWHSTFTGYIMRLRGYHNPNPDGLLLDSYYYVPVNSARSMHRYAPLQGAFFNREFPTAWRQLDFGVGDPGIATIR